MASDPDRLKSHRREPCPIGTLAIYASNFSKSKRRLKMAKVSPWHSIKQSVHHDNTNCNTGNNIERENRRDGTGGKPRCAECVRLA